jgi:uncharacterized protein YcaQ
MEAEPTRRRRTSKSRGAPGKTVEARENQLISLAVDLAEKQLAEGTASAQVITHYLRLGTTRAKLEKEKLRRENQLLAAKTESLQSAQRTEELYKEALISMRTYKGEEIGEDETIED